MWSDRSIRVADVVSMPGVCSVATYAAMKKFSADFLRGLGLCDVNRLGKPAIKIPYFDADGHNAATRFRTALAKSPGGEDDRFRWVQGAKPMLYGLWRIRELNASNHVTLVEGESDCHASWSHGISALGIPGAGN